MATAANPTKAKEPSAAEKKLMAEVTSSAANLYLLAYSSGVNDKVASETTRNSLTNDIAAAGARHMTALKALKSYQGQSITQEELATATDEITFKATAEGENYRKASTSESSAKTTYTAKSGEGYTAVADKHKDLIAVAKKAINGSKDDELTARLAVGLSIAKLNRGNGKSNSADFVREGQVLTVPTAAQLQQHIKEMEPGVLADKVIAYKKEVKGRTVDEIYAQRIPTAAYKSHTIARAS